MSTELVCSNKLACIGQKIGKVGSMGLLKVREHSPEILAVAGVAGIVGATVMACKATLKAKQIVDDHNELMNMVHEAQNIPEPLEEYSEIDIKKDTALIYIQTGQKFLVLYGPSILLGVAGIGCLLGAQVILKKRNVALMAAYGLIEKAFAGYRERVVEELGKEADYHYMYNTEYKTISEKIVGKDGKKKTVKHKIQVVNPDGLSMYSRLFSEQIYDDDGSYVGSSLWSKLPEYNAMTLVHKNQWCNDHLRAKGYLFLNEVYDELGFPQTSYGQIVGWRMDGDGDHYISFGPEVDAIMDKTAGYQAYEEDASIVLDFNVDGVMWDKI